MAPIASPPCERFVFPPSPLPVSFYIFTLPSRIRLQPRSAHLSLCLSRARCFFFSPHAAPKPAAAFANASAGSLPLRSPSHAPGCVHRSNQAAHRPPPADAAVFAARRDDQKAHNTGALENHPPSHRVQSQSRSNACTLRMGRAAEASPPPPSLPSSASLSSVCFVSSPLAPSTPSPFHSPHPLHPSIHPPSPPLFIPAKSSGPAVRAIAPCFPLPFPPFAFVFRLCRTAPKKTSQPFAAPAAPSTRGPCARGHSTRPCQHAHPRFAGGLRRRAHVMNRGAAPSPWPPPCSLSLVIAALCQPPVFFLTMCASPSLARRLTKNNTIQSVCQP